MREYLQIVLASGDPFRDVVTAYVGRNVAMAT